METGIENEIVHDVASLLLEAEVLFCCCYGMDNGNFL